MREALIWIAAGLGGAIGLIVLAGVTVAVFGRPGELEWDEGQPGWWDL